MSQINPTLIEQRAEAFSSASHKPDKFGAGRRQILNSLVREDLNFEGQNSSYGSHNFHAFAAKFPPQIPRLFIEGLTLPGEAVLDPMMGSGTALLEAQLLKRQAIGCDLDPLAIQQSLVKTTWVSSDSLMLAAQDVMREARQWLATMSDPEPVLHEKFTQKAIEFIRYWFLPETQLQLLALVQAIGSLPPDNVRNFLEIAFSAIIVTKSGGVSMARDLAHSRPHRVADKIPRDALKQFETRVRKNIHSLAALPQATIAPVIQQGDARRLMLEDLRRLVRDDSTGELEIVLGGEYVVKPDVIIEWKNRPYRGCIIFIQTRSPRSRAGLLPAATSWLKFLIVVSLLSAL